MPEKRLSVEDLRREATIADAEIAEAVDAYLTDPKLTAFQFASGHTLDIRAAGKAHWPAMAILAGKVTSDACRRSMIRAAVILAPVEGARQGLS